MWIRVYPNWKINFNSKNGGKKSFCYETDVPISLTQWGECVFVPNHENKGDYYVYSFLPQLIDELRFQKMVGNEVFL